MCPSHIGSCRRGPTVLPTPYEIRLHCLFETQCDVRLALLPYPNGIWYDLDSIILLRYLNIIIGYFLESVKQLMCGIEFIWAYRSLVVEPLTSVSQLIVVILGWTVHNSPNWISWLKTKCLSVSQSWRAILTVLEILENLRSSISCLSLH